MRFFASSPSTAPIVNEVSTDTFSANTLSERPIILTLCGAFSGGTVSGAAVVVVVVVWAPPPSFPPPPRPPPLLVLPLPLLLLLLLLLLLPLPHEDPLIPPPPPPPSLPLCQFQRRLTVASCCAFTSASSSRMIATWPANIETARLTCWFVATTLASPSAPPCSDVSAKFAASKFTRTRWPWALIHASAAPGAWEASPAWTTLRQTLLLTVDAAPDLQPKRRKRSSQNRMVAPIQK